MASGARVVRLRSGRRRCWLLGQHLGSVRATGGRLVSGARARCRVTLTAAQSAVVVHVGVALGPAARAAPPLLHRS